MVDFKIGQKWISNAEPELGMGRVHSIEGRTVTLTFDLADEERTYAANQAPLTRVRFNPGDSIGTRDGVRLTVDNVIDREGIFVYRGIYNGTDTAIVETELDPNIRFSKPQDRLFTRQIDENAWFNLRYFSLMNIARLAASRFRGLYGPRVSLIPHQLYIAGEVASRFAPRVLLADEVGLGKTIEAGLIIHQQLQTGRSRRILLIVPPALTFQWFVEMIRRFNLPFTVMNEERCQQIVADNTPEEGLEDLEPFNPFDAQQLVLCSLDLFTDNPDRLEEALDADWDLLVVDEAHHLEWSEEDVSLEYKIVEMISRVVRGLLLLTATPEQLGRAGHFARLRLLDPDRFHSYGAFAEEEAGFETVAAQVADLLEGDDDERAEARAGICSLLGLDKDIRDNELISALLDRHGTGRVLFRNVRSSVAGFPDRIPLPVALSLSGSAAPDHVKIDWLIDLLGQYPTEKFLVICETKEKAITIEKHISRQTAIRVAVFHEELDLIARDRAATYFAEPDNGAQVLVCSEIGSEGRNFQFASNLVLYDLPKSPDLLEQRIGRLDRIGQRNDVSIHIPYVADSLEEDAYRWYAAGVNAFAAPNPVAQSLYDVMAAEIGKTPIDELVEKTRRLNTLRREALQRGRDRLLELNSHKPEVSSVIVDDISRNEGGKALADYMEKSFEQWGLESEPLSGEALLVKPSETMVRHYATSLETLDHYHYPELPEDGIQVTFDRATALSREDVIFLTWEAPLVQQALDVVASDIVGNSTMIAVRHPSLPSGTLLVETLHVVDCVAPARLSVDRYLPPDVLRSVISPQLADIADQLPFTEFDAEVLEVQGHALHRLLDSQITGIRRMIDAAHDVTTARLDELVRGATSHAAGQFDMEISRLAGLREVNPTIRPEEIEFLEIERDAVLKAIRTAEVRLDAIRVIVCA